MTKTFAVVFCSVLGVSLIVASNGLPDCPSGYQDTYPQASGCSYWENQGFCAENSVYRVFMETNCKVACGFCEAGPTPPPPYTVPALISVNAISCLAAHNDKRALHGVPDLEWDDTLASESEAWALHLAQQRHKRRI